MRRVTYKFPEAGTAKVDRNREFLRGDNDRPLPERVKQSKARERKSTAA